MSKQYTLKENEVRFLQTSQDLFKNGISNFLAFICQERLAINVSGIQFELSDDMRTLTIHDTETPATEPKTTLEGVPTEEVAADPESVEPEKAASDMAEA